MAPSSNDKSRSSNNNTNTTSSSSSANTKSDYGIVKDGGFGNNKKLMESYGLRLGDQADHEEAKSIIEGFRKVDEANKK